MLLKYKSSERRDYLDSLTNRQLLKSYRENLTELKEVKEAKKRYPNCHWWNGENIFLYEIEFENWVESCESALKRRGYKPEKIKLQMEIKKNRVVIEKQVN